MPHLYAIGIGSNRPHGRHGRPAAVVEAAIGELDRRFDLFDASPILLNAAQGGAGRDFANAVALVASSADPLAMLAELKAIERGFGRRPGRRWGPRVLDLDILDWDGGRIRSRRLTIPHAALEHRVFMLQPLAAIAPDWRLRGGSGKDRGGHGSFLTLTARHLAARLARRGTRG